MKSCCNITNKSKKCKRKDGKLFKLPRKFSQTICLSSKINGFSMKSSCAPFKFCKKRSQFLYHPDNPDKSYDVYIDKDPSDTIPIKYTTLDDVKKTIKKLERLYKSNKYTHKRIWQVGMILYVRLKVYFKKNQIKRFLIWIPKKKHGQNSGTASSQNSGTTGISLSRGSNGSSIGSAKRNRSRPGPRSE